MAKIVQTSSSSTSLLFLAHFLTSRLTVFSSFLSSQQSRGVSNSNQNYDYSRHSIIHIKGLCRFYSLIRSFIRLVHNRKTMFGNWTIIVNCLRHDAHILFSLHRNMKKKQHKIGFRNVTRHFNIFSHSFTLSLTRATARLDYCFCLPNAHSIVLADETIPNGASEWEKEKEWSATWFARAPPLKWSLAFCSRA